MLGTIIGRGQNTLFIRYGAKVTASMLEVRLRLDETWLESCVGQSAAN